MSYYMHDPQGFSCKNALLWKNRQIVDLKKNRGGPNRTGPTVHSGVLTQWAFAQGGGNSRPGDWAGSWALGRIGPRGAHTRGALRPRARTNQKAETTATAHAGEGAATAGRSRGHGDGRIWSRRVHSGRIQRRFVVGVGEGALVAALTTWKRREVRERKREEREKGEERDGVDLVELVAAPASSSGEDADGAWCGSSLPWSSGTREREATRGLSRAPDGLRWAATGLAGPAAVGSAGVRWRRHMAAQGWLETARGDVARPDWSGARRRRRQVAVGGWMCTEFEEEVGIAAG